MMCLPSRIVFLRTQQPTLSRHLARHQPTPEQGVNSVPYVVSKPALRHYSQSEWPLASGRLSASATARAVKRIASRRHIKWTPGRDGSGDPGLPRLFFYQHFKPVGACAGDSIARPFFPGHFIPAPFFNEGTALVGTDFL
jgi:hypothetical protein